MKHISTLLTALTLLILASCGPAKNIIYLQDLPADSELAVQPNGDLRLQPGDKLTITVYSRDSELSKMFNLLGNEKSNEVSAYTVDNNGNIDMPIIGSVHVAGLTRLEVADKIKYRLLSGSLLRDPVVIVSFPAMAYYVIGESGVGRYEFPDDHLTLLEAISLSGDMTIHGKRTNVRLIRTEGGKQHTYAVDLTNADDLYSSPAYYVRQGDMIYIEPNQVKQNQSTPNGSQYMTPTFWISMFSFLSTLLVLFIK